MILKTKSMNDCSQNLRLNYVAIKLSNSYLSLSFLLSTTKCAFTLIYKLYMQIFRYINSKMAQHNWSYWGKLNYFCLEKKVYLWFVINIIVKKYQPRDIWQFFKSVQKHTCQQI